MKIQCLHMQVVQNSSILFQESDEDYKTDGMGFFIGLFILFLTMYMGYMFLLPFFKSTLKPAQPVKIEKTIRVQQ